MPVGVVNVLVNMQDRSGWGLTLNVGCMICCWRFSRLLQVTRVMIEPAPNAGEWYLGRAWQERAVRNSVPSPSSLHHIAGLDTFMAGKKSGVVSWV